MLKTIFTLILLLFITSCRFGHRNVGAYREREDLIEDEKTKELVAYALNNVTQTGEFDATIWDIDEIEMVETQVVRGVNYRITVRMVNEESEKARTVIVIWEDIPVNTEESGEPFSLTSFEVEYI